jgi:hypothetical protein
MLLRIYWDDQKRPAVEAPMGDFFCNAFGKRYEVANMPVVVGPTGSYNCFWYMPFRKSARPTTTSPIGSSAATSAAIAGTWPIRSSSKRGSA